MFVRGKCEIKQAEILCHACTVRGFGDYNRPVFNMPAEDHLRLGFMMGLGNLPDNAAPAVRSAPRAIGEYAWTAIP